MEYDPIKSTWLNPRIEYLFNSEIVEYDMKAAGISIIAEYELLPVNQIDELITLDKYELNKKIGILQRDRPGFSKLLLDNFVKVRSKFISENNLTSDRIITVKKDAIYTIGKCENLIFGKVAFVPKATFSSYLRLVGISNIEIFYNSSGLEVKGIGVNSLNKHRLYLLEFIRKAMKLIEEKNPTVKRYLREFTDQYKANQLEEPFYLEFNNASVTINPIFNLQKLIVPLVQVTMGELL